MKNLNYNPHKSTLLSLNEVCYMYDVMTALPETFHTPSVDFFCFFFYKFQVYGAVGLLWNSWQNIEICKLIFQTWKKYGKQ